MGHGQVEGEGRTLGGGRHRLEVVKMRRALDEGGLPESLDHRVAREEHLESPRMDLEGSR